MPAQAPAISIVLPCFNVERTLAPCLESLFAQTFTDFEILLHDDGSTDGTLELASTYAGRDRRLRIVSAGHRGIAGALQRACALARGALIARMDGDDVACENRLERQAGFMHSHPDVALCGTQVTNTGPGIGPGRRRYETWVNQLLTHEDIVRDLFVECPIPHPTFMMRRSAFESVGGYRDCPWPEDYDLLMRLHASGFRFGKVAARLLAWRHSPERLSMTDDRYSPESFRALKRHYLLKTRPREGVPFYQWGAGEVGKAWLKEWDAPRPAAVVDINPRKIGRTIHATRVISPGGLPGPGKAFVVVAVGAPGARDEIRAWFGSRAYVELRDYLFLA